MLIDFLARSINFQVSIQSVCDTFEIIIDCTFYWELLIAAYMKSKCIKIYILILF